jgi:hypothetical protein
LWPTEVVFLQNGGLDVGVDVYNVFSPLTMKFKRICRQKIGESERFAAGDAERC